MVQSKATRTRQKLAKLKSQVLGIAGATKINDTVVQAAGSKVSQRQLWNDHICSIGRQEAFARNSDTQIANTVRFAWFPLSLILVLLGAKWGSEMGIVRRIDELHAENQHLKAQENVAHCLEEDYNSESSPQVDASSADIGFSTIDEIHSGLSKSPREDPVYRLEVQHDPSDHATTSFPTMKHPRESQLKKGTLVATNITHVNMPMPCHDYLVDDTCKVNRSKLAAQDDGRYSVPENGQAISIGGSSMTFASPEKVPVVSAEDVPQGAALAIDIVEDTLSDVAQPFFTPTPKNASWRLSWATVDSEDVASKNDGCHSISLQSRRDLVVERKEVQLIPWLSCVSCETSPLRHFDSTGRCLQSVNSVHVGINLSWQCNSPECVALFSSQLQLMHSFKERTLQSQKPMRLQSDSRLGTTNWQLSWSTYLQKVVSDAGAEMSLLARSTCGRYAEYFQQVVDDAAKALHQDRSVTWRLPWFGSRSSQRQDLPLFASPVSFFDKEDMFHPKATWRLVWTQSML